MLQQIWHLALDRENERDTEIWLAQGRLIAAGAETPRAGDYVFLRRRHRGAFLVGRVLEDAHFAAEGIIEAKMRWAPLDKPVALKGFPKGDGLQKANAGALEHRLEARRWLEPR